MDGGSSQIESKNQRGAQWGRSEWEWPQERVYEFIMHRQSRYSHSAEFLCDIFPTSHVG